MTLTHGIPNLFVVEQDNLEQVILRGGTPTDDGWVWLKSQGITDVIKLNTKSESTDAKALQLGMVIHNFPIPWWRQVLLWPSQSDLVSAVALMKLNSFVHCGSDARTASADAAEDNTQGGEDRTGLVVGCFRLSQGWTKADAYAEMLAHGFHPALQGLVGRWNSENPTDWIH
jgi:hypothetical protein